MKAFKSAAASVTETMQNSVAKKDAMSELNKAAAQAKADQKSAGDKAAKHEAKGNYHARQAEILRELQQKKANNKAEKEQKKAALHQKKLDHPVDETAGDALGDDEQTTSTPPASPDIPASAAEPSTQEVADDQYTFTPPASSDVPEPSSEAREDTTDTDLATAASPAVEHSQVPMHGSGVPTHSTLHSNGGDPHDSHTTQTMEGSPNTGSYM